MNSLILTGGSDNQTVVLILNWDQVCRRLYRLTQQLNFSLDVRGEITANRLSGRCSRYCY